MKPLSRARVQTILVMAALGVAAAVTIFHVPLQSLVVLGLALACPLMMLGMHAGGGHAHGPGNRRSSPDGVGRPRA